MTMKYKIDDPKVWQQACELMVSMGVQRGQSCSKPEPSSEIRRQLRFILGDNSIWTNGHILRLRRIYLAAFNGMRFCNEIEREHRAMICELP